MPVEEVVWTQVIPDAKTLEDIFVDPIHTIANKKLYKLVRYDPRVTSLLNLLNKNFISSNITINITSIPINITIHEIDEEIACKLILNQIDHPINLSLTQLMTSNLPQDALNLYNSINSSANHLFDGLSIQQIFSLLSGICRLSQQDFNICINIINSFKTESAARIHFTYRGSGPEFFACGSSGSPNIIINCPKPIPISKKKMYIIVNDLESQITDFKDSTSTNRKIATITPKTASGTQSSISYVHYDLKLLNHNSNFMRHYANQIINPLVIINTLNKVQNSQQILIMDQGNSYAMNNTPTIQSSQYPYNIPNWDELQLVGVLGAPDCPPGATIQICHKAAVTATNGVILVDGSSWCVTSP